MRTGNYELSQALAESNFRSFHARHSITGREVLVHFLAQGGQSLLDTIAGLSAESRALLLDAGEQEGASYLVTVPIAGFTTLEAWLSQSGKAQVTPPVPPPVAALPESSGEFTQLFAGVPAAQVFTGVPAALATPKVPSVPADAGASFTQMFQPEKASPVPAPKVPRVTVPPPFPGWGGSTPDGSFTEFFKPESTPLPGPMAAPVPTAPPGEFTEIYRMSGQPAPPISGNAAPRNPMPPKAARWPAEPRSNDFAEFFEGRETPAPAPAWNVPPAPSASGPPATFRPPPSADPVGSATEFFQGPLPLPGGSVPGPVARPTTGPSDFTSIVGGRGTSSPAPPRANPLPAPPGEWPPFSYPVPPPAPSLPTLPPPPALPLPPTVVLDGSNRKMVLVGVLSFVIMVGFMAIVYLLVRK